MSNKKIKNATQTEVDNIRCKSMLEAICLKRLKDAGFSPYYEKYKIILLYGKKLNFIKSIMWSSNKGSFMNHLGALRMMTYTPDFVLFFRNNVVIIETKGRANDVYPYKRKLFLHWLERAAEQFKDLSFHFFQPKNTQEVRETVEILINMTSLKTIYELYKHLPEKDIPYAEEFIKKRDFSRLFELISSDIKKIQRKKEKTQDDLTIEAILLRLLDAVDDYKRLIEGESEEDYSYVFDE